MTRPPRLLDSSSNDALRSLLDSGLDDAPSPDALPKVAAALGLASATVTASGFALVSGSAKAATAATAKGAALAGSAPAAVAGAAAGVPVAASAGAAGFWGGSSALALGKTLLVSMLSAGTLSAGAVAVHEYVSPSAPSVAHVERAREAPPRTQPPAPRARGPEAAAKTPAVSEPAIADTEGSVTSNALAVASGADANPVAEAHPAVGSTVARTSPEPASRPDSGNARTGVLAREVKQIDAARQALESRDADSALAAIDSYERSRVFGVLDREALLLKIEALSQKHELAQAQALARQYLARFPTDTHAPKLRALLGSTPSSVQTFPRE